jgi:hypothetical protein
LFPPNVFEISSSIKIIILHLHLDQQNSLSFKGLDDNLAGSGKRPLRRKPPKEGLL